MGFDLSRTITFVPVAYILVKLLWTLVLIRMSFETTANNAFKLTLRSDSRVAEWLLVMTAIHEAGMDRWILSKTEMAANASSHPSAPGVIVGDLVLIFYVLYLHRESTRKCKERSPYDTAALFAWVLLSLLCFAYEMMRVNNPSRISSRSVGLLKIIFGVMLSCSVSVLFSDGCLLVHLEDVSFQDLCMRCFGYSLLVTSRCYMNIHGKSCATVENLSNLMFFSHLFILKSIMAGLVFCLLLGSHSLLFISMSQVQEIGAAETFTNRATKEGSAPALVKIDESLMAKLQEMEAGMHTLNETRRRSSNIFAPQGLFAPKK